MVKMSVHSLRMLRFARNNSSAGHLRVHFGFGTAVHLAAFASPCLHIPMGLRLSFALQPIRVGIRTSAVWRAASRGTAAVHLLAVMSARQPVAPSD